MSHNLKSIYKICINEKLIPNDTTYKQFFTVINEYHKGISDAIMKGYNHKPNSDLGEIHVIKDIRRGETIDWGSSNKLKAAIIAQGGVPYNKETAPNGEKWHVHYTDKDYYKWVWFKINTEFVKNIKYYIFKACTRNRRTVGKIVKEDQLVTASYVTYK